MIDAVAKALALWAVPYNDWEALSEEQRERWRDAARAAVQAAALWESERQAAQWQLIVSRPPVKFNTPADG
jgi:uncharacterized protein (DUF2384 family)